MPLMPISAPQTRAKDEDALYAFSGHPVSSWVGAVDMADGRIILLGALELSGRVETSQNELRGFYEDGHAGSWLVAVGEEGRVFQDYIRALAGLYGRVKSSPPSVWCSWYSLYNRINEQIIDKVLRELEDFPFDVVQLDDGWQIALGDWDANHKFPGGMAKVAERIHKTRRKAGLWLAPFVLPKTSRLVREHPDWILRDETGKPAYAGIGWSGDLYALDSSHPDVLDWLEKTIRKVVGWGYDYLKLDFLYAAAIPGKYANGLHRETAYRQALQVIRDAAGKDTYLLACGAPIFPVLGLFDGLRIGPDVTPYWVNKPLSVWINNPNNPGTQNAIRTCIHRLWLKELIHIDPDVTYFRSRNNWMSPGQKQFLQDLALITSFKASSDLPAWLKPNERAALRGFLESNPVIVQGSPYRYRIDGREVDFSPILPLPDPVRFPYQLALAAGMLQMGWTEWIPAVLETWIAKLYK